VAFHLPQFHQIPENDHWWGEGYTEWDKVRVSRPLFPGHYQPRIPLDRRYYDMLSVDTLAWQQKVAGDHGIDAFCYYHYWFRGRELLERPLDLLLRTSALELPFCLAWANEPWTRSWDGDSGAVLVPQSYGGLEDWERHISRLILFFKDQRYLRVNERPVFLIYRTAAIDDLQEMLACWTERLQAVGISGLYLVEMATGFPKDSRNLTDALADFEPIYTLRHCMGTRYKALRMLRTVMFQIARTGLVPLFVRQHVNYSKIWQAILSRPAQPQRLLGAFPDWDNTPRRGVEGLVVENASPGAFRRYFSVQYPRAVNHAHPLLFINAWNEWSEGAYLEPDERHSYGYLEAVRDVVRLHTNEVQF
jgi:lipopolysaccharide biosynthesis protein